MRIIAGSLRGRQFKSPPGHRSHPMSEKMRGALFNVLGDISGLTVLDAFAGSGAVSFEAVSRGAQSAYAVEKAVLAYRAIRKNIDELDVAETVKATRANISTWSDNNRDLQFDIVVADPPYDAIRPDILKKLTQNVADDGVLVVSWPGSEEPLSIHGWDLVQVNEFGDSKLLFLRQI